MFRTLTKVCNCVLLSSEVDSILLVDGQFVVLPLAQTMKYLGWFQLISPLVNSRPRAGTETKMFMYDAKLSRMCYQLS